MNPRLQPLAAIFALNTDLVGNCAADLSDAQAKRRLEGGGNSIAFLIAHLTDVRHFLADLLGSPIPNPLTPYLAEARSIDDVESLPPLAELLDAWRTVSTHLVGVFDGRTSTRSRTGCRSVTKHEVVLVPIGLRYTATYAPFM